MDITPLLHTDLHIIHSIQPEGWDIKAFHEFYTSHDYCFPTKIMDDERIVGIGTTILHNNVAWLAHIIVHPDYRNQGIGKIITENLVVIANAHQCETIYLLATELGEPVYRKIGFENETDYVLFKGEKVNVPMSDVENIAPYHDKFKEEISKIDRQVSGEDRMFHLEPHLSGGFVYVDDNKVKGFYLPTFGDGVILAIAPASGLELMKVRCATKDNAGFPIDNAPATAFMKQHHFKEFRIQKRMRLGKKRDWQPANIYNRIGGNLG